MDWSGGLNSAKGANLLASKFKIQCDSFHLKQEMREAYILFGFNLAKFAFEPNLELEGGNFIGNEQNEFVSWNQGCSKGKFQKY